jgi:hypothetical protein
MIDSTEIPIYSAAELPTTAFVPVVIEQLDPSCGINAQVLYNMPLNRLVVGSSASASAYSLAKNLSSIEILATDKNVIPAYVATALPNTVSKARSNSLTTRAQFLILANDPNSSDRFIVQSTGTYSFPTDHNYVVGYTYYLSDTIAGQTITLAPTAPGTYSQKLFTVIDRKTILVHVEI